MSSSAPHTSTNRGVCVAFDALWGNPQRSHSLSTAAACGSERGSSTRFVARRRKARNMRPSTPWIDDREMKMSPHFLVPWEREPLHEQGGRTHYAIAGLRQGPPVRMEDRADRIPVPRHRCAPVGARQITLPPRVDALGGARGLFWRSYAQLRGMHGPSTWVSRRLSGAAYM